MSGLLLRLRALLLRRRMERDLDDEVSFHLDMETRKNLASGMPPEQAARGARLQFGTDPGAVKDYIRDERGIGFLETLFTDVLYALRGFRRTPLFALTVIGTIAIGLGWNTAAFTIFNAYLLRPIYARDPYSLYAIGWQSRDGDATPFAWSRLKDLRQEHPGLTAVTATLSLRTRLNGRFATCTLVDGGYFKMLGVNPAMGRVIAPEDDYAGSSVVVLSYEPVETTHRARARSFFAALARSQVNLSPPSIRYCICINVSSSVLDRLFIPVWSANTDAARSNFWIPGDGDVLLSTYHVKSRAFFRRIDQARFPYRPAGLTSRQRVRTNRIERIHERFHRRS